MLPGNASKTAWCWIVLLILPAGFILGSCGRPFNQPLIRLPASDDNPGSKFELTGQWKMKTGSLAPANYYLPAVDDKSWQTIHVPSNWYLQGVDTSGVVWFRRHFTAGPQLSGKIVKLVFEGVDYTADVWLNGTYLGFHEGYFSPFFFLVSDIIKPGADNILVVKVNSPYEEPGRNWGLRKRLVKGIFNHHDTRPGGAWSLRGQEKNSGGIWAPVYLQYSKQTAINSINIAPRVFPDKKGADARIAASVSYEAVPGAAGQDFVFDVFISPYNFKDTDNGSMRFVASRSLRPGKNLIEFNLTGLDVRLWWPWELGRPHLYRLVMNISRDGILLDSMKRVFGFRSVHCDPETKIFSINGRRIFLRGTNYIGSQWLSEMTPARYAGDLALMKKANINAVRVHAHVAGRQFYDLCDLEGMLVWQDFPLQWGYTDDKELIDTVKIQAREMVDHLFNHPAVIAWCGHNEPPWDADWMRYKYQDYDPEQNKELDEELYQVLKSCDPSRYVQKHSSTAEHPWCGWYSGSWLDYGKPARHALISEFGAQALPDLKTLKTIFSEDALWPDTEKEWDKWRYHNFQPHENFDIAGVKMGADIDEFIANSQQYQARLIKYAAESYRLQKYAPVSGIFQFMFVENWPSINWGVVDYRRDPKPGYFALKSAYQPLLPIIEHEKEVWQEGERIILKLWIVNDLHKEIKGAVLKYFLKDDRAIMLEQDSIKTDITPDGVVFLKSVQHHDLAKGSYVAQVVLTDSQGKPLAENSLAFFIDNKRKQSE